MSGWLLRFKALAAERTILDLWPEEAVLADDVVLLAGVGVHLLLQGVGHRKTDATFQVLVQMSSRVPDKVPFFRHSLKNNFRYDSWKFMGVICGEGEEGGS